MGGEKSSSPRLNPYFIGLSTLINIDLKREILPIHVSILILLDYLLLLFGNETLNADVNGVSILILLDYLLLYERNVFPYFLRYRLNPYFIGLSTLILQQ